MTDQSFKHFDITSKIISGAIEVHRILGPGMLESAYEECLAYELEHLGFMVERQKPVPIVYKDVKLDCGYRIDLLINDLVLLELKSVDVLNPIHEAQVLTYLHFSKKEVGLLINFNVKLLKDGIKRYIK